MTSVATPRRCEYPRVGKGPCKAVCSEGFTTCARHRQHEQARLSSYSVFAEALQDTEDRAIAERKALQEIVEDRSKQIAATMKAERRAKVAAMQAAKTPGDQ
jgi:hypothetical protein